MVNFTPREEYKEIKENTSENFEPIKELSVEERIRREEEEKQLRKQENNFLEQQLSVAEPEPIPKSEFFSYQTNNSMTEYSIGDNGMEKFWEEKRKEEQKSDEERRKRSLL